MTQGSRYGSAPSISLAEGWSLERLTPPSRLFGANGLRTDLGGGPPRVLLENLPMPNAMEFGPDGKLYYPVLGTNDIWRIDPAPRLGAPTAEIMDELGLAAGEED